MFKLHFNMTSYTKCHLMKHLKSHKAQLSQIEKNVNSVQD